MKYRGLLLVCSLVVGVLSGCSTSTPQNDSSSAEPPAKLERSPRIGSTAATPKNSVGATSSPSISKSSLAASSKAEANASSAKTPPASVSPPAAAKNIASAQPKGTAPNRNPTIANRARGGVALEGESNANPAGGESDPEASRSSREAMAIAVAKLRAEPTHKTGTNPGDTIPEIEGADLDGDRFALSDYEGKVLMIDFWGDW